MRKTLTAATTDEERRRPETREFSFPFVRTDQFAGSQDVTVECFKQLVLRQIGLAASRSPSSA